LLRCLCEALGKPKDLNLMDIKKVVTFAIFSIVFHSNVALSADNKTFGLGIGSLYNGIGMSYGYQSQNSYKYVSLGCLSVAYSSDYGSELNCGIGAGFIMTGLFKLDNNKHGFGAHFGATYNEHYSEIEYFIAPQYVYFFNGINKSGWNLGGSVRVGKYDGESDAIPSFQVGYQF
jgi:hypothetical protein